MFRALASIMAFALLLPATISAQSLEGMWRLVEMEVQGGPNEGMAPLQGGLLAYTDSHFVWALDVNTEPRPLGSESPSDAEIVAGISGFVAQAGTYELDGSTIRYTRTTAMNPNAALPEAQPLERELVSLTEDRLETSLTNDEGVTTILKYERVD